MEFPAISQTRVEFWKEPQYTQNGMWWFTLFFGAFGLHHLLLRSPQTTIVFAVVNMLSFGYLWFYDLIQLSSSGGHDTDSLNQYGLAHPWGPLGLAQGMWIKPEDPTSKNTKEKEKESEVPSPWWFFAYSLLLPISPLAHIIAGDKQNALSRFMFLTIIPFGFFLYGASMVYDYWSLIGKPADLTLFGTKRFFPFTLLGYHKDGHSPNITAKQEVPEPQCPPPGNWVFGSIFEIIKFMLLFVLPVLYVVNPPLALSLDQALNVAAGSGGKIINTAEVVVQAAQTTAETAVKAADIAADSAIKIAEDGSKVLTSVGKLAGNMQGLSSGPLAKAQALMNNPKALLPPQQGGGQASPKSPGDKSPGDKSPGDKSPLDWLAFGGIGAVVVGGFLLAGGRTLHVGGKRTDTPPDARDV
jgi:hypothetical protein